MTGASEGYREGRWAEGKRSTEYQLGATLSGSGPASSKSRPRQDFCDEPYPFVLVFFFLLFFFSFRSSLHLLSLNHDRHCHARLSLLFSPVSHLVFFTTPFFPSSLFLPHPSPTLAQVAAPSYLRILVASCLFVFFLPIPLCVWSSSLCWCLYDCVSLNLLVFVHQLVCVSLCMFA